MITSNIKVVQFNFSNVARERNKIYPRHLRVDLESRGTFICDTNHRTTWFHRSKTSTGERLAKISSDTILVIESVTSEKVGTYYCYGAYEEGFGHFLDEVELLVYGKCIKTIYNSPT